MNWPVNHLRICFAGLRVHDIGVSSAASSLNAMIITLV